MNNTSRRPHSKPRRPSTSTAVRRNSGPPQTPDSPMLALKALGRQCLKYVDQADSILSTLFITTHSMSETGMLEKLKQKNLKELHPSEVSSVLMALMNTPIGRKLFPKASETQHPSIQAHVDPEDE